MQCFRKAGTPAVEYAVWLYAKASLPWLVQVSEPLWSTAGVRQGGPCGPCLFALTFQDSLEVVGLWHPEVRVTAYLDETYYSGRRRLSFTHTIFLQPSGTGGAGDAAYSSNASNAEEIGILLGFSVSTEGIVIAGCPVAGSFSLHRRQSRLQKRW